MTRSTAGLRRPVRGSRTHESGIPPLADTDSRRLQILSIWWRNNKEEALDLLTPAGTLNWFAEEPNVAGYNNKIS